MDLYGWLFFVDCIFMMFCFIIGGHHHHIQIIFFFLLILIDFYVPFNEKIFEATKEVVADGGGGGGKIKPSPMINYHVV